MQRHNSPKKHIMQLCSPIWKTFYLFTLTNPQKEIKCKRVTTSIYFSLLISASFWCLLFSLTSKKICSFSLREKGKKIFVSCELGSQDILTPEGADRRRLVTNASPTRTCLIIGKKHIPCKGSPRIKNVFLRTLLYLGKTLLFHILNTSIAGEALR